MLSQVTDHSAIFYRDRPRNVNVAVPGARHIGILWRGMAAPYSATLWREMTEEVRAVSCAALASARACSAICSVARQARPAMRYRDGLSIGVVRALYSAFWSCRPI
jgi:hypothetical protein